jgi:putative FmdB family regulatory protein
MPIYGYACKSCGHTLDALQKMADEPLVDCPECNEPALKRQLSAPRFRLKGQGWYETDFKKDNQRNLASDKEPSTSDKASDKVSDKASDKTSDSKDGKDGKGAAKKAEEKPASKSTPKAAAKSSGDKASTG